MQKTLIDAGPIIALFDRSNNYHTKMKHFMSRFKGMLAMMDPNVKTRFLKF